MTTDASWAPVATALGIDAGVDAGVPKADAGADAATADAGSGFCRSGMILVSGHYCFRLSHECLQSAIKENPERTNRYTDPNWLDKCFVYKFGSASCGEDNYSFNLHISLDKGENIKPHAIEPGTPIAKMMYGKKMGEKLFGCRISGLKTLGNKAEVGDGSLVTLDCPPLVPMRFCIDEYEYPNRKGEKPARYVSWRQAAETCADEGKRLCLEHEWTTACQGPNNMPYPYGWKRDDQACNISRCYGSCGLDPVVEGRCLHYDPYEDALVDRPLCPVPPEWMRNGDPGVTGSKVTKALEVIDQVPGRPGETFVVASGSMPGCVSPYGVTDMTGNVDEWVQCTVSCEKYPSVLKGGHGQDIARNRCDPRTTEHGPAFKAPTVGFRCCSDALE